MTKTFHFAACKLKATLLFTWLPPGYPTPPPSPSEQKELLLLPVDRECCLGLAPPYPVIEEDESLRMCTGGVPGVLYKRRERQRSRNLGPRISN